MKHRLLLALSLLLVCSTVSLHASEPLPGRHTVRMGWGDMLFETLVFHSSLPGTYPSPETLPSSFTRTENYDFGYTGHFYAEYSYRLSRVVSVGIQADVEGIFWKEGTFDRYHKPKVPATQVRNWDIVLMPTVRFTYLNRPLVRLYSGLGAGALFALDNAGGFQLASALNFNWIGVEIGKGHWGGNVELGMLNALTDAYHVFQLGSRLVSFGAYYKW